MAYDPRKCYFCGVEHTTFESWSECMLDKLDADLTPEQKQESALQKIWNENTQFVESWKAEQGIA